VGGNILVFFEPGEVSALSHGKNLEQKTIKCTQTNSAPDRFAIEYHDIIHLMTKLAGPFLADNFDFDAIPPIFETTGRFFRLGIFSIFRLS
jgi:hypothetical protein